MNLHGWIKGRRIRWALMRTVMAALTLTLALPAPHAGAAPDDAFAVGEVIVVDTDLLNLRAEPAMDGEILAVLMDGTIGEVTDGPVESDGHLWYAYNVDGLVGWSVVDFLDLHADTHEVLPPATEIIVVTDALNLRLAAGLGSLVIDVVERGSRGQVLNGPVTGSGIEWYQVAFPAMTGWVARTYIAFASSEDVLDFSSRDVAVVNTDELNVRASASISAEINGVLEGGAELVIVAGPTEQDGYLWYRIDTDDLTGWVAGVYLRQVA